MKILTQSALLLTSLVYFVSGQTPPGFSALTNAPSTNRNLFVEFDNVIVTPGRLLDLDVPTTSPKASFPYHAAPKIHLVLMIDLDAPFADANRSFSPLLHWLQPSISATLWTIPDNYTDSKVPAIAPYIQAQPPIGSAPHRYVVLAFQQPQKHFSVPLGFLNYYDSSDVETRFRFSVATFIKEAGLKLVAANWFQVQNTLLA
ncbi:hypothetical protein H2200_003358 [Cladophialophora chaetospira]|uniref:PEBP-like protein n=1 Tax=Cladophialophora chaetospira TaxID=386627 RepID=A0AA39CMM0_9EURO|nr:hypothetical protein H2200_003358 [Cladophialophora chaetospira]